MIESMSSTLALRASMVALCASKPDVIVWSCRWLAWVKATCCWSRISVNLASSAEICAVNLASSAEICAVICAASCWMDWVMASRGSTGVCGHVLDIGNSGDEIQK